MLLEMFYAVLKKNKPQDHTNFVSAFLNVPKSSAGGQKLLFSFLPCSDFAVVFVIPSFETEIKIFDSYHPNI